MIRVIKRVSKFIFYPYVLLLKKLNSILRNQTLIINKMSLPNDVLDIGVAKFWLLNSPRDYLQSEILANGTFFDYKNLELLSAHIKKFNVVVNVGANICNHCLYWCVVNGAKRVYAFEPVPATYEVLQKNIEIKDLSSRTITYSAGLSNRIQ